MQHVPQDLTFSQSVSALNRMRNRDTEPNWTLDRLEQSRSATLALSTALERAGIGPIPPVRLGGNMALVIPLSDNRILRVVDAGVEAKRPPEWKIWQPHYDMGTIEGFHMELYPRVQTLDAAIASGDLPPYIGAHLIEQTVAAFAKQEQFLWDCKPENFCVVKAGDTYTLFVLDAGAVVPMHERHGGRIGNDTHTYLDKFGLMMNVVLHRMGAPDPQVATNPEGYLARISQMPTPAIPYEGLQRAYANAIGLAHGQAQAIGASALSR